VAQVSDGCKKCEKKLRNLLAYIAKLASLVVVTNQTPVTALHEMPQDRDRRPSDYVRRMRERIAQRDRIARGENEPKPMRNNLQIGFILLVIAAIVVFAIVMSSKI
jgi:hypothetical protein